MKVDETNDKWYKENKCSYVKSMSNVLKNFKVSIVIF